MNQRNEHHKEHECGCKEGRSPGGHERGDGHCGCGNNLQRRYETKEEKVQSLEKYLKDLKLEIQAVEQTLADLQK
jgi:hypothetical protein